MAGSEGFFRLFNFTAAAEAFSDSLEALDTSIVDLVEELDASKEHAQAVVFILQHPRLIACLQAAFVLLLFTFYLVGIGDAPPAAANPQDAPADEGRPLLAGWARMIGLGHRFRNGAAANNDAFPGAGVQGDGAGGGRDIGDRDAEFRARPLQQQQQQQRPVPRAAAGALSKWLFLAVCGAGWVIYSKHSPEHQTEINERFQKGTKSFHRKVAFANLVDEASGPRPQHGSPRRPHDRWLPWPGADTFRNGLFVPRSNEIIENTTSTPAQSPVSASDSDLSSQANSEVSSKGESIESSQSGSNSVSRVTESLWTTCVRVSNKLFGSVDHFGSSRDSSSPSGSRNSNRSNVNGSSSDDTSRDFIVPPLSPQEPSAATLSSAELALLRRASPQPELYCGKPVPTNKGKKSSRKKRRQGQGGWGSKSQHGRSEHYDGDDDEEEDEEEDDEEGHNNDAMSGGRGRRKRALRGGSDQFTPKRANKAPVHGLVAEAFIDYERPGKHGAHLFRVDLEVQNRGLLTVQLVSAERRIVGDALPHPLDSRHPLHNKYLSRLLKRHLTETAEATERKKQATKKTNDRKHHSSTAGGQTKRRYFSADNEEDDDEDDGDDQEGSNAVGEDDPDATEDEDDNTDDSSSTSPARRASKKKKAPKKSSNKMRDKSVGRGRLVKKSPRWRNKRKHKRGQSNADGDGIDQSDGETDEYDHDDDDEDDDDEDDEDEDVLDNGGGLYASHEWAPAFSYSSLEPAGLGPLEESVIGPRFGGIGDQHTVAKSNLTVAFVAVVPHPRAAFHGSLQFQVLRSNPHHVPLRRRFLARAHVIASERAGNASLAALAELERLATVERNKQPSPEEHASQERDQAPRLQQAEAQAQAREDTATAAATAAEEKPRAQAKAKRMRVKQLAVAASAGARAYAEHIAAAAERAKSWYPQVGDWLSVPINRVAMIVEPGDNDDDEEEEEADIDVDDFLYGYCPGANGGGGGAFVPNEKWREDRVADAAADVAVAQYWAGEVASESTKLAWKRAQPHAFASYTYHSNSSSSSSSSGGSASGSDSGAGTGGGSNRGSDQIDDGNKGDGYIKADFDEDEDEVVFGPLYKNQRRNDLLYGGSKTAAIAAQRASEAAELGWSPAEIESGGLREVEAGGVESTGVAVGERVVVSARLRFEKLEVVDLPDDDEDDDEDEGDDDEEVENREEKEESSDDINKEINAEVNPDGSITSDNTHVNYKNSLQSPSPSPRPKTNKRGTVGWFGDSTTGSRSAAASSESNANGIGHSADTSAAAATHNAGESTNDGGAPAANGGLAQLYNVLAEASQGGLVALQGLMRGQSDDVMAGWHQASNALTPPLLWAVAGVLGDRPALAARASDLGYPTLSVEVHDNSPRSSSSSRKNKSGKRRSKSSSSSSSDRPHVKLEPRIAVCEGTCHNFECPLGTALFVGEALLGRTSREVCEHPASSRIDCVRDITTAARDACTKQQDTAMMFSGNKEPNLSCRLCEGQDGVGGDPHFCENTFKYVNVSYACVNPEDLEELNDGPPMDTSYPLPKPPRREKRQMFELTTNLQNMRNGPIIVLAHRITFTALPSRLEDKDHHKDDAKSKSDDGAAEAEPEHTSEADSSKKGNSAAKKTGESLSFAGGREWFRVEDGEPSDTSDDSSIDDDNEESASRSEERTTASDSASGEIKPGAASSKAEAKDATTREEDAPVVVVFEGIGVGGEMHFVGGRGDHNFGNPAEQVILIADDEHKSSLLIKSLFDLPNHQGPWQVEVAYAVESPHPLLSGLLPWLPVSLRPTPKRIVTFHKSKISSERSRSSDSASSKNGSGGSFNDVLNADNNETKGGRGSSNGAPEKGWLRGEVFETSAGPMRVHAAGSP